MKKYVSILLSLSLLTACHTPAPEVLRASYAGVMDNYQFYHAQEGRDQNWEEDILYLAQTVLDEHQRFAQKCWTQDIYSGQGEYREDITKYDEALKTDFLEQINLLIPQISNLSDTELLYALQKITASLCDGHTKLNLPDASKRFPFAFEPFYDPSGNVSLYAVTVPEPMPELMFAELEGINGIPTAEVMKRLEEYVSCENDCWAIWKLTSTFSSNLIINCDALEAAGIIQQGDESAQWEFKLEDGTVTKVEISSVPSEKTGGWISKALYNVGSLMYENIMTQNFWHECFPDEELVYVRINRCKERSDLPWGKFFSQVLADIRALDGAAEVVIDLRGNSGGLLPKSELFTFISVLNNVEKRSLYVLMDGGTFSSGMLMASFLRQYAEGAVLAGLPAGQPPNVMGPGDIRTLPNSQYTFTITYAYFLSWPGYEENALVPDVFVYPAIEDYRQGIDSILEEVRNFAKGQIKNEV